MSMQIQSKGLQTRMNLLNAAKELFYENGFSKTSAKEICESANVKPSNFNYYFDSKDMLLKEIYADLYMKCHSFVDSNITYKINSIEKNVLMTFPYMMGQFKDEKTKSFHYETIKREPLTTYMGGNLRHLYKQFIKDLGRTVTEKELVSLINADLGLRREIFLYFLEHPESQDMNDLVNSILIFRARIFQMDENMMKAYIFNAYEFERNYDHSHICLLV
ncbi:MAG: TetR/AcrR family transcriptional regulator [Acetobacterium woodii]|nr:TetR/AcrR family transcriptional regulator [Acetobacterium woodii]